MMALESERITPLKTNMTMEKPQFEDVSRIKDGDFPLSCYFSGGVSLPNGGASHPCHFLLSL